jgi:membrane protein implicated in regulation of membrane protease activity
MLDFLGGGYFAKTYFVLATSATLLFILKMIFFSFLGADADVGDVDVDGGDDMAQHNGAFSFVSLQSILAFLMGFGWIGLAGIWEWHLGKITTFLVAFAAGAGCMALSVWLMFQTKKLNNIHENSIYNALSKTGRAYTRFAPSGSGQIQIELNGRISTINAINNKKEEIAAFDAVQVVAIKDHVLYVQKVL